MKALVTWTGTYLKPNYNSDHDNIKKSRFKVGEVYEIEYKKPRNIKYHRKYFALLNLVYSNQEYFEDFESFREYIIIKSGYYIKTVTAKGEFFKAKSISFASMDNIAFEKLFDSTLDVVIAEFIPISKEEIKNEIAEFY